MAEPKTQAEEIHTLFPWLLHWTIADDRIGGFRSDAYALKTPEGTVMIDPLPLAVTAQAELEGIVAIFMTHGNHQRSVWRFRRELGAPVYAPSDVRGLDEEPDVRFDEGSPLPGNLRAMRATGFREACYLGFMHEDGTAVLFCGDLITQDPRGPYRFPVEPSYFDPTGGVDDAERLLELPFSTLCAAHAAPTLNGCQRALRKALEQATE